MEDTLASVSAAKVPVVPSRICGIRHADMQQDGATSHATNQLTFYGREISRFVISWLSDVNLFARSCHLTPLDFFLWIYVKLEHLKAKIRDAIEDIVVNVPKNIRKLIKYK